MSGSSVNNSGKPAQVDWNPEPAQEGVKAVAKSCLQVACSIVQFKNIGGQAGQASAQVVGALGGYGIEKLVDKSFEDPKGSCVKTVRFIEKKCF
jgi:hypothetical protein